MSLRRSKRIRVARIPEPERRPERSFGGRVSRRFGCIQAVRGAGLAVGSGEIHA